MSKLMEEFERRVKEHFGCPETGLPIKELVKKVEGKLKGDLRKDNIWAWLRTTIETLERELDEANANLAWAREDSKGVEAELAQFISIFIAPAKKAMRILAMSSSVCGWCTRNSMDCDSCSKVDEFIDTAIGKAKEERDEAVAKMKVTDIARLEHEVEVLHRAVDNMATEHWKAHSINSARMADEFIAQARAEIKAEKGK